jgi:tRNA nucleotidyltransferase/poly(A) polymerase
VRWAALLHDLGKVDTRQVLHEGGASRVVFYGHDAVGAEMAARVLERLRYPRVFVQRCVRLVGAHMFRYEHAWKPATVRRFMARVGVDVLEDLFALREADSRSRHLDGELAALEELRARVALELREKSSVHVADLAVDGEDVMRVLGVGPGPQVGRVLQALLERVLERPALNRRDALLRLLREDFSGGGSAEGE